MPDAPSSVPSSGYSWSLIVAALGVTATTLALMGALYLRAGRDPVDAVGLPGQVAFAASFGLLFATRLIFSPTRTTATKAAVRGALAAVLGVEVVLAGIAAVLVLSGPPPGLFLGIALALALICQAGTLIWLLRYRSQ